MLCYCKEEGEAGEREKECSESCFLVGPLDDSLALLLRFKSYFPKNFSRNRVI